MNKNQKRAKVARAALAHYAEVKRGMEHEHDQTRLADLLADMMHAAALSRGESRISFDNALYTARANFNAERKHVKVLHGKCDVCGHHGADCTGSKS